MTEDFELETVLSVTSGINCADNFDKVYELAYFIFDDDLISPLGLGIMKKKMREHILDIHPELTDIIPAGRKGIRLNSWIDKQKAKFGDKLPISQMGEKLSSKNPVKTIGTPKIKQ